MRLDSLVRLIETADFSSFRELALVCLSLKGYHDVTLSDGWNDGGTDVRVFQMPPNATRIAFQITVERDWKAKLAEDAAKAKIKLKLTHMTFVCSRRVAEYEFQKAAESVWRKYNVRATKIDGQAIASTFFEAGQSSRVLEILGIRTSSVALPTPIADSRAEVACAFVFFGKEAGQFREGMIESAIASVGSRNAEGLDRAAFEKEVCVVLQLEENQGRMVTSIVDRMIQRNELSGAEGVIKLPPQQVDAFRAMVVLRESEWAGLHGKLCGVLKNRLGRKVRDEEADAIMADVGALMMDTAEINATAARQQKVSLEAIRGRIRHLHATLDAMRFPDGGLRSEALADVVALVCETGLSRRLIAGQTYLLLSAAGTPQLISALGGRTSAQVMLDASVAIPMLCGLLYSPVGGHFSYAAHQAYVQIQSHGFACWLPSDYLEETATHLVNAFWEYARVVDLDSDLRRSENAFVAHYVNLKRENFGGSFEEYLASFGLDESLRKAEFYRARDAVMPRLQRNFDRYGIRIRPLARPDDAAQRRAEEGVGHAMMKLGISRPDIVLKHDIRTVAYLYGQESRTGDAWVLCTWDALHMFGRDAAAQWLALNPHILADLLSMASPDADADSPVASLRTIAMMLSDEAAAHGAAVWDTLARIEKAKLHDAELLAQAQSFKADYVRRMASGERPDSVEQEWARWKKHNASNGAS